MLDSRTISKLWTGQTLEPGARGPILLENAAIDVKGDRLCAQGWLSIDALHKLRVDDYQREILSNVSNGKSSLQRVASDGSRMPGIVLGMRGDKVSFPKGSSNCQLLDNVYIIDGLQRVSALRKFAEENPEKRNQVRIGTEIRFDTDHDYEDEQFLILNARRVPMSPNVVLRNLRVHHPGVLTVYGLSTNDRNFALYGRVCWYQRMAREHLITATTLSRAVHALHGSNATQGSTSKAEAVASSLDADARRYKMDIFRENIREFFEIVDVCWGIRSIEITEKQPQLRGNWLVTLARVFAQYQEFWRGHRLFIDAKMKRKLMTFPLRDPEISRLCGAGNAAVVILDNYLITHLNKGKKIKLKKRERD